MIATVVDVVRMLDLGQPSPAQTVRLELALAATIEAVVEYTGRSWDLIDDDTEPTTKTYPGCARVVLIADVECEGTTVEQSADMVTWAEVPSTWWHFEPFDKATANRLTCHGGEFARWVRVTGRHGHFFIPAAVKQATVLKAAALFERNPNGIASYGGPDFGPIRISRFEDPDVARLLDTVSRPALSIA